MAATSTNRFSTYTSVSGSGASEGKNGEQKKDMWSSMLDSVASVKRLPEKNLLVMGMSLRHLRNRWTEQELLTAPRWNRRVAEGIHRVAFQ